MTREMVIDEIEIPPSEDLEPPGMQGTIVCENPPAKIRLPSLHRLPIIQMKKFKDQTYENFYNEKNKNCIQ